VLCGGPLKYLQRFLQCTKYIKLEFTPSTALFHTSSPNSWNSFNIRSETLKLLLEGAGNSLELIGIGKDFLNRTPPAHQLRERMSKWDFIKLKSFSTTKEMVTKLKRPSREWEKIFASYTSDRD
jgi:hypothetical protein